MLYSSEALKTLLAQPKRIRTKTAVLILAPPQTPQTTSGFFIVILDHECGISNVRIHTFEITSMKKTLDPDTPRDDDLL